MPKRAWGLLVVASLVSATTAARADEASSDPTEPEQKLKMPIAYAQRGRSQNPALTLTPGLGLDVSVIGSLGGADQLVHAHQPGAQRRLEPHRRLRAPNDSRSARALADGQL